ncbi:MAG: efflux transporter outer membrane subunit [Planctomycetaceae bacterium]|nr:efflux transporter outer membrane subunit [Planctomycetaceae bacterium]
MPTAHRHRTRPLVASLLIVAACLASAGCCTGPLEWVRNGFKVGPNYCPPAAPTSEMWIDANNPRLKCLSGNGACWWTVFNDPTLDTLIAATANENLTLKMAGCRILEARAERGVAVGNLFPQQQQLEGSYTRNALGNGYPLNLFPIGHYYDNTLLAANAAWELDFWGRFRRAIEAADANLEAQCAGYNNVLVLLQAEVASNYIQMRSFEERLQLAQRNVNLQRETLRIISLREKAGLVTELDVQQATYNLGQTESLIPVLDAARRRTQNRLCILMAKPPQELSGMIPTPGAIPAAPPDVVVGIPAELLRRRPDVQQAERVAALQSARIGVAEAEFYPHIAITGTIGVQAQNFSNLFNSNSVVGQIGPGFNWNVLNYGRIKNNFLAQDARFQQAVLNYRDTVLRANEEVENGIVDFLREQERVAALTLSTNAAARSAAIATQQYEKGVIYYQPLLDSERVLTSQQDTLAESRGLVALDLVAVYKALGGGWQATSEAHPPQRDVAASPQLAPPPDPIPVPPRKPQPQL